MASFWFLLACICAAVQSERLYNNQPTVQSRYPTPTPPRPGQVPVSTGSIRQATFLPQNLTFIVSLRNLKTKSVDPKVKVSHAGPNGTFVILGETETLDNNANPDFLKVFSVIWNKGTQQKLKFEVRDVDNFRHDDPLGQVVLDLDDYVLRGEKSNLTLQNGTGTILIQKTVPVKFRLYARSLPDADVIGTSDPYVECYWSVGSNGKLIKFAQSAVVNDNENPDWNQTFEFANYVRGTEQYWTFKVLDSDPAGSDDLGEVVVEIDPFVLKRQTKIVTLAKKGSTATSAKLGITPV